MTERTQPLRGPRVCFSHPQGLPPLEWPPPLPLTFPCLTLSPRRLGTSPVLVTAWPRPGAQRCRVTNECACSEGTRGPTVAACYDEGSQVPHTVSLLRSVEAPAWPAGGQQPKHQTQRLWLHIPHGEPLSEALMPNPCFPGAGPANRAGYRPPGASADGQIHVLQARPYTPRSQLPSPRRAAPCLPGGCTGLSGERGQAWQVGVASCSHSQVLPSVGQQELTTPLGQVGRRPRGTGQKQPQGP